jgi:hypothetical protein
MSLAVAVAIGLALVAASALAKGTNPKADGRKGNAPWLPWPKKYLVGTITVAEDGKAVEELQWKAAPSAAAPGAKTEKTEAKVELPEAAAKAVKEAFPAATLSETKIGEKNGVKVFELKLKDGEAESEVVVTAGGVIVTVGAKVELEDVPEAAAAAIKKAAEGAKINKVEKIEVRAEAKDGEVAKLEKAKIVFEAKLTKQK